eukprot:4186579-Pyramimonas_sp.AAC.1
MTGLEGQSVKRDQATKEMFGNFQKQIKRTLESSTSARPFESATRPQQSHHDYHNDHPGISHALEQWRSELQASKSVRGEMMEILGPLTAQINQIATRSKELALKLQTVDSNMFNFSSAQENVKDAIAEKN